MYELYDLKNFPDQRFVFQGDNSRILDSIKILFHAKFDFILSELPYKDDDFYNHLLPDTENPSCLVQGVVSNWGVRDRDQQWETSLCDWQVKEEWVTNNPKCKGALEEVKLWRGKAYRLFVTACFYYQQLAAIMKPDATFAQICDRETRRVFEKAATCLFGPNSIANEFVWVKVGSRSPGAKTNPASGSYRVLEIQPHPEKARPIYLPMTANKCVGDFDEDRKEWYTTSPLLLGKGKKGGGTPYSYPPGTPERVFLCSLATMLDHEAKGELLIKGPQKIPYRKHFKGTDPIGQHVINDTWTDISNLVPKAEYAGFDKWPTQKPEAFVTRLLEMRTKEGDLVGDFTCGSGVVARVAERMRRQFFVADIDPRAIKMTLSLLYQQQPALFDGSPDKPIPTKLRYYVWVSDYEEALKQPPAALSEQVCYLMGARPYWSTEAKNKLLYQIFPGGHPILVSVVQGQVTPSLLNEFNSLADRSGFEGVRLISTVDPSPQAFSQAGSYGCFDHLGNQYPKIWVTWVKHLYQGVSGEFKLPETKYPVPVNPQEYVLAKQPRQKVNGKEVPMKTQEPDPDVPSLSNLGVLLPNNP